MDKGTKLIIAIAAFVILLMAAYIGYGFLSKHYKPESNVSVSNSQSSRPAAPNFTIKDANGNDLKLSDFKGKPVILNFWASWCPHAVVRCQIIIHFIKSTAIKGLCF
jgi:cytochrome oxidase Cu insertion factor (SCO1/SenC/PrrC family)